jgi:hypothetical protein
LEILANMIRNNKIPHVVSVQMIIAIIFLTAFVRHAWAENHFQEYQVKAAYLYNFAKFVEWPEGSFRDSSSPIKICVLGSDPFGKSLDDLGSKSVGNRKLEIERLQQADRTKACHILFISAVEKESPSAILRAVQKKSILTVGETKGFTKAGGIINLVKTGDKVSFEINRDAAERSGLKISSQLLKLAIIVKE